MANLLTIIADPSTRRRRLLMIVFHKVSLPAAIMACRRRGLKNTLMNLASLPTSAAPLFPRSRISRRKLIRRRLRVNRSMPQLSRLELYLNLSPPRGLLKLGEGTIVLGDYKLPDILLDHSQVSGHLSLL